MIKLRLPDTQNMSKRLMFSYSWPLIYPPCSILNHLSTQDTEMTTGEGGDDACGSGKKPTSGDDLVKGESSPDQEEDEDEDEQD